MTNIQFIQNQTNIVSKSIEATIKLLQEDCTIPFIYRYRKDQTGNLDEVQIEQISKLNKQFDEIVKRKESVLSSIEEQGFLTPELKQKIEIIFLPPEFNAHAGLVAHERCSSFAGAIPTQYGFHALHKSVGTAA